MATAFQWTVLPACAVGCLLAAGAVFAEDNEAQRPPESLATGVAGWQPATTTSAILEQRTADQITATFSIVAVDPDAGECGAAVASMYPSVGTVVPYVRAGVGAFCSQHWHEPKWGEPALDMLAEGLQPEAVLAALLKDDPRQEKRQLAIIDMQGRAANRNPSGADPSGYYWGGMTGRYYACQGNTLTGAEVIMAMTRAYEGTKGSLADRLMAALVAGDCAGGDHRGRLAAGIRVAKVGEEGLWLDVQVDQSDDAVIELARKYAALEHAAKGQRGAQEFVHPCADRKRSVAPQP